MTQPLLRVSSLGGGYGDVKVLHDVSLSLAAGDLACIVGSNGAGKSTLLRTLAGLQRPFAGTVHFRGVETGGWQAPRVAAQGLVLVPEGRRLFAGLSVEQNLMMGAHLRSDGRDAVRTSLSDVYALFPRLHERRRQEATTLSGGEQQMCAVGRGLMAAPALLMIDELSLGLAPAMVDLLVAALSEVNRRGTGLLVVEQDVGVALELARHGFVLDHGTITRSGASDALLRDPAIGAAYLGLAAG
ncbi:ATP-binding cassette domain-containing protein [Pandoraea fibrosis]|uniref:ATP-binding cassette domain-containing protein n=1 Tax=Pandoraea fibrosis TaxID=1891094 RepID=A0ABX6HRE3_9BURK|nr:ABC transporter ATP-binding protein [Pandoraea fibrosis]QHE93011.1 ATP-binding cassette domain-containing protein [Pandoraea fibrosis]QHF13431.1 ATP-binding cassette domain-containing protein [Pandoraea fibrosis]